MNKTFEYELDAHLDLDNLIGNDEDENGAGFELSEIDESRIDRREEDPEELKREDSKVPDVWNRLLMTPMGKDGEDPFDWENGKSPFAGMHYNEVEDGWLKAEEQWLQQKKDQ